MREGLLSPKAFHMNQLNLKQQIAEAVREACLKAARDGYENAGISGLCEEGRWECALGAIRSLDLAAVIAGISAE